MTFQVDRTGWSGTFADTDRLVSTNPANFPEAVVLYPKRPKAGRRGCGAVYGRFGCSGLKEAAGVRGGRYGISIDFGLEVVEKRSTCGETFKSKFIDPTMKPKLTNRLIVTRDGEFFKTAGLEPPMPAGPGHAQASAAKRLRSSRFLANVTSECCSEHYLRFS